MSTQRFPHAPPWDHTSPVLMASRRSFWQRTESVVESCFWFLKHRILGLACRLLGGLFQQLCLSKTSRASLLTIDSLAPPGRSDAYSYVTVKSFVMNFHHAGLQFTQLPWPDYLSRQLPWLTWSWSHGEMSVLLRLCPLWSYPSLEPSQFADQVSRSNLQHVFSLLPQPTGQLRQKTVC